MTNPSKPLRATLLLGTTLTVMAGAIVAPALPQISKEFSNTPSVELLSRLILTLPALFMAILAPLAGFFVDKTGRKKVLLFSLVLYAIAGTSGLYLDSLIFILAGRAVLGIAVGGVITSVITLIGDYFDGEERNRFLGLQAAFAGLGGLVFITLGGFFADIHWRMPFAIYILSLVIYALAYFSVSDKTSKTIHVQDKNSTNKKFYIPTPVFWVYITGFLSMIVFYMIPVQIPFMLNKLEGITNSQIGIAIAFVNLASVITSLLYKHVKRRFKFTHIMGMVYILVFLGFLIIGNATDYWMFIPGILIAGFGFGIMMPNINLWLITLAPSHIRGRLVGYLNFSLFLGMFSSPLVLQPLVNYAGIFPTFRLTALILGVWAILMLLLSSLEGKKSSVKPSLVNN